MLSTYGRELPEHRSDRKGQQGLEEKSQRRNHIKSRKDWLVVGARRGGREDWRNEKSRSKLKSSFLGR